MSARDLAPSSSGRLPIREGDRPASARSRGAFPPGSEPAAAPPALAARYRSLFVIGRGGMGAVEAALEIGARGSESPGELGHGAERHAEGRPVGPAQGPAAGRPEGHAGGGGFQRVVALKRLLPDSARDARRVEMFLREAKLAAMLDHPNVVRAFDYGAIDGELFLAMEYVEGQALSRVLKALAEAGGALGPSLTAHVLAEVCEGLHAAHELRDESGQALALVHRDVSPQNVMLAYDGHVRLLDFGVAKIDVGAESVTKTGEVKGKTAYMSPEQAMGDAIDRRSDLFGIGAVLFECLALRRMWGDGTDMDVIRKLALEQPPKLEEAVPDAPAGLCALYTRLVAREASGRPGTALDAANELRAFVPEGREAAARATRALLEAHFGEQARAQHRRLTAALEEVAPEQARELRESVSPDSPDDHDAARTLAGGGAPAREAARSSSSSVADATGANPAARDAGGRGVAGVAGASREARSWLWVAGVALVLGGLAAWRLSAAQPGQPPVGTPTVTTASATATTSAVATATAAASASAAPVVAATVAPDASGAANALPNETGAASTTAARATTGAAPPTAAAGATSAATPTAAAGATSAARTGVAAGGSASNRPASGRPVAPGATIAPTASPAASAPVPRPAASPPVLTKPPPDVDDHPF